MKFGEVIGQKEIAKQLIAMADEERIPHALMFCGALGSGKMAMALAFASYILGEKEGEDTPKSRNTEAMLRRWQHPDLHFVYPVIRPAGTSSDHKMVSDDFSREWNDMLMQGAYFTIDHWLDQMNAANQQAQIGAGESDALIHKLNIKSSQGGYKVCIIWLAERMNTECANKLLKLLEEPPQQTVIIMVCEDPSLLLETIRSRTQRVEFKQLADSDVESALIERRGIDEENAHRIARFANGNWMKAVGELDVNNENSLFLEMFIMLMRTAYTRNTKDLKRWSEAIAGYGREKQSRFLDYLMRLTRENFIYNFKIAELNYMTRAEENFSMNFAKYVNERNVVDMFELMSRCKRDIKQNANAKIVFFDMALNMTMLILKQ